jgi:hypothetical protein
MRLEILPERALFKSRIGFQDIQFEHNIRKVGKLNSELLPLTEAEGFKNRSLYVLHFRAIDLIDMLPTYKDSIEKQPYQRLFFILELSSPAYYFLTKEDAFMNYGYLPEINGSSLLSYSKNIHPIPTVTNMFYCFYPFTQALSYPRIDKFIIDFLSKHFIISLDLQRKLNIIDEEKLQSTIYDIPV